MVLGVAGCSRFMTTPELPVASSLVLDELIVYSDFRLPEDHRLLRELELLRGTITEQLAVPVSDAPVHVYIFKTSKRYKKFLRQHYPGFPDRRAFFVETDTRLSVYTYWGDRIAEDLRHEVCHGYLHAVVPRVPLWLDEGLAENFEGNSFNEGLNRAHLDQLLAEMDKEGWRPDLERLEQFKEMSAMQQLDYAEAWLWVHYLMRTTAPRKQILRDYLAECRHGMPPPISDRLLKSEPDAADHLLAHLAMLREQTLLFQDDPRVDLLESSRPE